MMCGIVACRTNQPAIDYLTIALRRLEYRGYDSVGVAVQTASGEVARLRTVGRVAALDRLVREWPRAPFNGVGIGRTRWATRGSVTEANAHPHADCTGRSPESKGGKTMPQTSHPATDRDTSVLLQEDQNTVTAEQVARVVAGIPAIGEACEALKKAGWRASIAGNRITVDDDVFAQFIGATAGVYGSVEARWVIYGIAGTPPVWIVGAEPRPRHTSETATAIWRELGGTAAADQQGPGRSPLPFHAHTPADGVGDECSCATKLSTLYYKEGN